MSLTNDSRIRHLRSQATVAPMLDARTERELLEQVAEGSEWALRRLIDSHMRLVICIADRFARHGVPLEDLVSEGSLGLIEAARRFDLERETRFGTYAAWWVRAYVRRYAFANRRMVGAPSTRNARRILWGLRRTERQIAQETGREATRDEVATELRVSPEEVAMVESALGGRDLSLGPAADDDSPALDLPGAEPSPEETAATNEKHRADAERVDAALATLSDREREIIVRRLLDDDSLSLATLGARFGVSRERVRQIQQRAEVKLRGKLLEQVA